MFMKLLVLPIRCVRSMSKGEPGSGAGQGGGTGGTIRDAGGSFGKREAAQEEQYFKRLVSVRGWVGSSTGKGVGRGGQSS